MLDIDDLKSLLNSEDKPTEREKAETEKAIAYAEYYKAKADAERIKAETFTRNESAKHERHDDIIFLISVIFSIIGIIAQLVVLLLIMF